MNGTPLVLDQMTDRIQLYIHIMIVVVHFGNSDIEYSSVTSLMLYILNNV